MAKSPAKASSAKIVNHMAARAASTGARLVGLKALGGGLALFGAASMAAGAVASGGALAFAGGLVFRRADEMRSKFDRQYREMGAVKRAVTGASYMDGVRAKHGLPAAPRSASLSGAGGEGGDRMGAAPVGRSKSAERLRSQARSATSKGVMLEAAGWAVSAATGIAAGSGLGLAAFVPGVGLATSLVVSGGNMRKGARHTTARANLRDMLGMTRATPGQSGTATLRGGEGNDRMAQAGPAPSPASNALDSVRYQRNLIRGENAGGAADNIIMNNIRSKRGQPERAPTGPATSPGGGSASRASLSSGDAAKFQQAAAARPRTNYGEDGTGQGHGQRGYANPANQFAAQQARGVQNVTDWAKSGASKRGA